MDTLARKSMAVILVALAILFLPVLLAVTAALLVLFYLLAALPLCPVMTARASCDACHYEICPWLVAIFIFIIIPVALIAFSILKKRSRLP